MKHVGAVALIGLIAVSGIASGVGFTVTTVTELGGAPDANSKSSVDVSSDGGVGVCYKTPLDELWFNRSIDGGVTWQNGTLVTDKVSGNELSPCNVVGVDVSTWIVGFGPDDAGVGNQGFKINRSTDGGLSWTNVFDADDHGAGNTAFSSDVTISSADPDEVRAVYFDSTNEELLWIESSDGGATWSTPTVIESPSSAAELDLVNAGATTWWYAYRSSGCCVQAAKSTDGGTSWTNSVVVGVNGLNPSIVSINDTTAFVAYADASGMAIRRTTNGGSAWSDVLDENDGTDNGQELHSIAVAGNGTQLVFSYRRDDAAVVDPGKWGYRVSNDGGGSWEAFVELEGTISLNGLGLDVRWTSISGFVVVGRGSVDGIGGEPPSFNYYSSQAFAPVVPPAPVSPPELSQGFKDFVAALGIQTPESELFLTLLLIGLVMVVTGAGMKLGSSGRYKNATIAGAGMLVGVVCVLLFFLDLWMFIVAVVLGIVPLAGREQVQNTWNSVRQSIEQSARQAAGRPLDGGSSDEPVPIMVEFDGVAGDLTDQPDDATTSEPPEVVLEEISEPEADAT